MVLLVAPGVYKEEQQQESLQFCSALVEVRSPQVDIQSSDDGSALSF